MKRALERAATGSIWDRSRGEREQWGNENAVTNVLFLKWEQRGLKRVCDTSRTMRVQCLQDGVSAAWNVLFQKSRLKKFA